MQPSKGLVLSTMLMTISIGVSMSTFTGSANAQNINGIFGTRSSEHFFQEGIDRMEQEIEDLRDQSEEDITVLTIDESIEDQRQDLENDGISMVDPVDAHLKQGPEAAL